MNKTEDKYLTLRVIALRNNIFGEIEWEKRMSLEERQSFNDKLDDLISKSLSRLFSERDEELAKKLEEQKVPKEDMGVVDRKYMPKSEKYCWFFDYNK